MKQLLYIRLRETTSFEFGVKEEIKERYSNVFDLDNFSDVQTVSYALKFFSQAVTKVMIDAEPKASFGKLLYLFNELRKVEDIDIEIIGEHKMLTFLVK